MPQVRFLIFAGLFLGQLFSAAWAGDPVTTAAAKTALLEKLATLPDEIDGRNRETGRLFQEARAAVEEARRRHDASESNAERLAIATGTLCNTNLAQAMMVRAPELELAGLRGKVKQWALEAHGSLSGDPVVNIHLWYQRFDFQAPIETYHALEENLAAQLPAIIGRVCTELEGTLFAALRPLAQRMDEINAEGQSLTDQLNALPADDPGREALENRLDGLKQERETLKSRREQLMREGQGQRGRALSELQFALQAQVARLKQLAMPERGRITGQDPDRVRFGNRTRFGVRFLGSGLPTGLTSGDITLPAGLRLLSVNSNARAINLFLEKGDDLQSGRHEIDIAGEKRGFTFEAAEETDPDRFTPLVSAGNETGNGTAASGDIPEDGKGTLLTPMSLSDHPQQQFGYWQYAEESRDQGNDERSSILRFARFQDEAGTEWTVLMGLGFMPDHYDDLIPHQRVPVVDIWNKGVIGQYDSGDGQCFGGLRSTKEIPDPLTGEERCPAWRWWGPSQLCFDANNMSAREDVDSKKHDHDSCEALEQHHALEVKYDRFVGLSFDPILPGKYIHTLTVGAPFQYLAEVKLSWDYSLLEPGRLVFIIRKLENGRPGAELLRQEGAPVTGSHPFSTQQPGQFQFEMQVFDSSGILIHQDFAAAFLDR